MKKLYIIAIILSMITFSLILWRQTYKPDRVDVDPATVSEMEYYFKQKECTQAMIDQSNGYDVKLPENCLSD
ncbi:hypothetical protein IQ219_12730 [Synechocystis sp. LEGE 06083]|uniref:hypothetical protein n=1 Tax=Synechocystis sp. LEGE 06083 TaxID=915336 RepID=UPI001881FAC7|nr:hypothetical protein [Synechocystis sp. LEGE 06083]MBE9196148.1 hypothetical protein [Synechocystis sp. LEGE 06083]